LYSELKDKVITVTGAGSFARAFVKDALSFCPKAIRIITNDEWQLVDIQRELKDDRLRFMVCDIRDKERLKQITRGTDVLVHSAALKHVPVCEYNPGECIKTNILGSLNVVDVAVELGIPKVLGISTDKAVHPISIYGASKLVMEKLFIEANNYTQTRFSCVRFGNLWGSSGSVIELWKEQVARGEPITVTDKEMTRYFIHIDEAVRFSITCINEMKGKEIFIPIMKSYTLAELASQIAPDCPVKIIGKRRGEKIKEQLVSEDEDRFIERKNDMLIIRYN
jgi:FlaA1/EpsC-like NDP-sugar epimerase